MYSNMPCSYRQGPSLGFVAEAGRLLLWRRLEYDFLACLLLYLASYFSFFFRFFSCFFLHPGMFIFFVFLSLCSSHLLLSATTRFIVRVLSACVICTLPHLGILLFFFIRLVFFFFFFHSSYFSDGVFLLCSRTRYAST